MGVGAQDVLGRVAASIGDLEFVTPEFQPVLDVPNGGVLICIAGLTGNGFIEIHRPVFYVAKRLLWFGQSVFAVGIYGVDPS